ncbi:MAG: YARHG domain-containing protein, partial [Leptospira sp.]|nr:YARHG domain-containing protein [Leptospira sp.]
MKLLIPFLLIFTTTLLEKPTKTKYDKIFSLILSDKKLDNELLENYKDSIDLRIIRNSIFAKHNYIFKSNDLNDFFRNFDWYSPKSGKVDHLLTPNDNENIALISKKEQLAKYTIEKSI